MIILGLTGSMGMGKSTIAEMFVKAGIPVHDSDATVQRLYEGKAVPWIEKAFPELIQNGAVDRSRLSLFILEKKENLKKLESTIHPLVEKEVESFIVFHRQRKTPLVVLESPLLFENRKNTTVDKILVASVSSDIQHERVFARANMTTEKFNILLANQISNEEKKQRADYVINTACSLKELEIKVKEVIAKILGVGADFSKLSSLK